MRATVAAGAACLVLAGCAGDDGGLDDATIADLYTEQQMDEYQYQDRSMVDPITIAKVATDGDCTVAYVVEDHSTGRNIDLTLGFRGDELVSIVTGHLGDPDPSDERCQSL